LKGYNMDRKEAYPVYITLKKETCKIVIPDLGIDSDFTTIQTLVQAIENARVIIENLAKEMEEEKKEIPNPGSVEYKKSRGEIFTYVDVNLDKLFRKAKTLEELKEIEDRRIHNMWNVQENVIEFLLNQKIMGVTLVQKRLIRKVKEYAEKYPEEVQIKNENSDGSIFAKLPTRYLRIQRPAEGRVFSEEEKAISRERLASYRNKKEDNQSTTLLENDSNMEE